MNQKKNTKKLVHLTSHAQSDVTNKGKNKNRTFYIPPKKGRN